MQFDIITIFPSIFDSYFKESIIKRAQEKKLIKINIHNLRDYTTDRHQTVDDRPYGGGPGMVLMVEPILKAVTALRKARPERSRRARIKTKKSSLKAGSPLTKKVILLSAKGKKFDQPMAQRFSKLDQLILISGRYEGVDERIARYVADEEISIGDYVLTGGEVPAMVIIDAVARLVSGVIRTESLQEESFNELKIENCKLKIGGEYPQYTRPESIVIDGKNRKVPQVLLSGNHKKIEEWRKKKMKRI